MDFGQEQRYSWCLAKIVALEEVIAELVEVSQLSSFITVNPPTTHRISVWRGTIFTTNLTSTLDGVAVNFRITTNSLYKCVIHNLDYITTQTEMYYNLTKAYPEYVVVNVTVS